MRNRLRAILGVMIVTLPSTAVNAMTPEEMAGVVRSTAEDAVRERLRDPESAQFSEVVAFRTTAESTEPAVVCGYVDAKNGGEGYNGRVPFVWIAFNEHLQMDFNHGMAFLGSEVYSQNMLPLCKFPIS